MERISAVATQLRGYGVKVEKMKRAGMLLRIIDDLKSESPELFDKKDLKTLNGKGRKKS